jgi:hypothetical protein
MTIMRATSALCLVLLSGCAGAMEQPRDAILSPRPRILHINGTFEPVTFVVDHKRVASKAERRQACQTNDPMPVAQLGQAVPRVFRAHPLQVAPMPNYCPVTVPLTGNTVVASTPSGPKVLQRPEPSEPQP